jgi:hypothetical protein
MLVKRHKPFLTAKQVAERVGGYTANAVRSRRGVFRSLTVHRLTEGGRPLFDQDEVDRLIEAARTRRASGSA